MGGASSTGRSTATPQATDAGLVDSSKAFGQVRQGLRQGAESSLIPDARPSAVALECGGRRVKLSGDGGVGSSPF